ncbi:MAG: DUF3078 domain-containing protein [Bacteroidales bacterium]|nr:DUF3078 domain-containing protein [Bacteroidales bacterium]
MKKILFAIALLGVSTLLYSQDAASEMAAAINESKQVVEEAPKPVYWKKGIKTTVNFGQTGLVNWAAGGYNTFNLRAYIDGNINYAKDRITFDNRLQLEYGFLYSADKPILQKSDDRIYFESKFGFKIDAKNLSITANFDFKSQFTKGFTYPKSVTPADPEKGVTPEDWKRERTLKSSFLAPAYTNLGIGINYNPWKWLNINFAPLTGGLVIVTLPELRKSYGNDEDKSVRFEFGAQLKIDAQVAINDVFSYTTQIVLFSNYLKNPQNFRVNWDNTINYKLGKYFVLNFITNLIYDPTILIKEDKDIEKFPDGTQRVQFKESLALGVTFMF